MRLALVAKDPVPADDLRECVFQLLEEQPCEPIEVAENDPQGLAEFLIEYASDLDLPRPADLLPHVVEWQRLFREAAEVSDDAVAAGV